MIRGGGVHDITHIHILSIHMYIYGVKGYKLLLANTVPEAFPSLIDANEDTSWVKDNEFMIRYYVDIASYVKFIKSLAYTDE